MSTCGTCNHWTPPTAKALGEDGWGDYFEPDDPSRPHGRGLCLRITMIGDPARPVLRADLAHVEDGSNYIAELFTKAEFGCVLWTVKP